MPRPRAPQGRWLASGPGRAAAAPPAPPVDGPATRSNPSSATSRLSASHSPGAEAPGMSMPPSHHRVSRCVASRTRIMRQMRMFVRTTRTARPLRPAPSAAASRTLSRPPTAAWVGAKALAAAASLMRPGGRPLRRRSRPARARRRATFAVTDVGTCRLWSH
jgi:hypothetical protein